MIQGEYALKSKTSSTYYGALPKFETMFQQIIWDRVVKCCLGFDTSEFRGLNFCLNFHIKLSCHDIEWEMTTYNYFYSETFCAKQAK